MDIQAGPASFITERTSAKSRLMRPGTVMTSAMMLITLLSLLLFGPKVIFGFTAAITLGIFVGTYSSVYMAAPILIWLKVTGSSFVPGEVAADKAAGQKA